MIKIILSVNYIIAKIRIQMNKAQVQKNTKAAVTAIIVTTIIWFGGGAFIDLVMGIYNFLDQYIWAFFAGIIAFFFSISLVGMMFQITLVTLGLILAVFGQLLLYFQNKKGQP
jgi:hypothetical protein